MLTVFPRGGVPISLAIFTRLFKQIRQAHDRHGVYLTATSLAISIPSIVRDLVWWGSFTSWMIAKIPELLADLLITIGNFVSPVLNMYRDFSRAIFQFLPFEIPVVVSSTLPVVGIVCAQYLTAQMSYRRANMIAYRDGDKYRQLTRKIKKTTEPGPDQQRELQRIDDIMVDIRATVVRYIKLEKLYRRMTIFSAAMFTAMFLTEVIYNGMIP